ncbi:MAG: metallophosphoesterase [Terriglobia bacterium]
MSAFAIGRLLVISVILMIFLASQIYWFRRVADWGGKLIPNPRLRHWLGGAAAMTYILLFAYMAAWSRHFGTPIELTPRAAFLDAPSFWWLIGSVMGFGLILIFWVGDRLVRSVLWAFRKMALTFRPASALNPADPPSTGRRLFLEQTAMVVSAAPFLVSAYGLLYGRLNLKTTHERIKLPRLPKAFHGFRVAQLSDIHIGPFMPEDEIRKYVQITNELRPDLILLTGDFITWDPNTQEPVVEALSGLKAPFGVLGCLGNHELWYEVEDSITRLFAARNIRILRQTDAQLQMGGDSLNFIGVDFQSVQRVGRPGVGHPRRYLEGVEKLVRPGMTNILLSHNPNTFDRAAELGIDLSLAGHTHGGQVTLEFIHPSLSPSRLITDYVEGWFKKESSQLYVNRGIGTMFVPVRLGAPPEITLFELVREA